jgi:hypothetical protein
VYYVAGSSARQSRALRLIPFDEIKSRNVVRGDLCLNRLEARTSRKGARTFLSLSSSLAGDTEAASSRWDFAIIAGFGLWLNSRRDLTLVNQHSLICVVSCRSAPTIWWHQIFIAISRRSVLKPAHVERLTCAIRSTTCSERFTQNEKSQLLSMA